MLRMLRLLLWTALLTVGLCESTQATQPLLLSEFLSSSLENPHGIVSRVQFSSDLIVLESGSLAFHSPHAMKILAFAEPVWVIGYRAEILDAAGKRPEGNHLCHTFLGDQRVTQHQDHEMKALYSDAFTGQIQFPEGFGMRFGPEDKLHWMPLFNNRTDRIVRVRMQCEVVLIREKDLKKRLKPLYSTLRSVEIPHLFFVPPGRHENQATFELAFNGRIHFIGTHMHPHGESMELYNVSRQEKVWRGSRTSDPQGRMIGMDVYSSSTGYPVRDGETYRIKSIYDNPTDHDIDAMAGVFLFYSRD